MRNTTTLSAALNRKVLTHSSAGLLAKCSRSTTPLVITPNTPMGEKPPALAPLMMSSPIRSGLMR